MALYVTVYLALMGAKGLKEVNELGYSAKDCFNELDDVRRRAREDKGNYNQELKAIELKGKLAGHFKDKQEVEHKGLASLLEELK